MDSKSEGYHPGRKPRIWLTSGNCRGCTVWPNTTQWQQQAAHKRAQPSVSERRTAMTNDDVSAICPNVQHGQQHAAHKRAQASASERRTAITIQNSVHDMCFALICRIARKSTRRPEEKGRELQAGWSFRTPCPFSRSHLTLSCIRP